MFYPSLEIQKVSRRYQKITDAFATLGGTASLLIMIGFLLIRAQNEVNLTNKIINQLYSFQKLSPKKPAKQKKSQKL